MVEAENYSIDKLEKLLDGEVLTDDYSLGLYATDASVYQIRPIAIVLPKTAEDVNEVIRFAKEQQISLLPRGGGTSLAGQTVGHSIIMDFSKYMNQVLELNEKEKWVRVQPGMVLDVLNKYLATYGLHFAPDPATSSRANVGGMVGNNSSGTKSILYGKTVDHVLEAKVILADGSHLHLEELNTQKYSEKVKQDDREGEIYRKFQDIIQNNKEEIQARFPNVMRRVGGYNLDEFIETDSWNLCKIITGSEGTLATTIELKLNLVALPKHKSVCVIHYSQLLEAIGSVETILEFNPAAVEILDKTVIDLSRENLTTKHSCHFLEGQPEAILIVEFYDDDAEQVMKRPQAMIERLKAASTGYAWPLFPEGKSYTDVWIIRKKGLGLMLGIKGEKKPLPFIEDAGIPTDVLPEYIDKVLKICKANGTKAAMYAHASVGVIHVRPILDLRQQIDIERFDKIAKETFKLVQHYGGSWSGEHGDGLVRSAFNKEYFGDQIYQALVDVKHLFDPENLMNPGKIINSPAITENLRYGSGYQDEAISTTFKFTQDNSFADAVHMCTGVGECRKILGGTMCPSFKATREEEHSTRGRANALRQAMSGQLSGEGIADQRMHEVMDLCISCKACKSECPSNVDMAKLKAEVSQAYYDKNGTKFRDRMIRDSAKMSRLLSGSFATLVNGIQKSTLFRSILQGLGGFDKRRTLPEYANQSFESWFHKNAKENNGKTVALFADTYLNYHEPRIGVAAYKLLTDCGYNVLLASVGCCQRPKISHGFLRDAKEAGAVMIEKLSKFLDYDIPVLVCEPSCASSLTDDLPDMLDDEVVQGKIQNGVMMIDQFLHMEVESGRLDMEFTTYEDDIILHGHCHQKALYGTSAMKTLLTDIDGVSCQEPDTGCCGMAGSFGYEKEHYAVSEKIGDLGILPIVKEAGQQSTVVACGFSCRHQINHFTGKQPMHWVEVIHAKQNNDKQN